MKNIPELLKATAELEIVAKKNAHSLLSGDYATTIPGSGMVFHEARKYVIGDTVRRIDWNMTARLGEPYVKIFQDEREREVVLALDVSPSMYTGWQDKTKIEYAVELAATLAVSATKCKDRIGFVAFSDSTKESIPVRKGKSQLFRILKTLIEHREASPPHTEFSDIRSAIHSIQSFKKKRLIIFLISDFIDHDIPDDLKYIKSRHDLNLLHIYDPLEYEESDEVRFFGISPEGKANRRLLYPAGTGSLSAMKKYLQDTSAKYRIPTFSISTKEPVGKKLSLIFHEKKRLFR